MEVGKKHKENLFWHNGFLPAVSEWVFFLCPLHLLPALLTYTYGEQSRLPGYTLLCLKVSDSISSVIDVLIICPSLISEGDLWHAQTEADVLFWWS